jgi:transmembrane sensor
MNDLNKHDGNNRKKGLKAYQLLRGLFVHKEQGVESRRENYEEFEKEVAPFGNSFIYHKYELPISDKEEIWNNLDLLTKKKDRSSQNIQSFSILKIAASVILVISVFSIIFLNLPSKVTTVATKYGETKSVVLPDGSRVVLNANSTLKYKKENPREVWIQGEGFFNIVHTRNNDKFLVRTIDSHYVQVLGTSFNVYNRKSKVEVVLSTGKIKLQVEGKEGVIMKPGELAELKTSSEEYDIRGVDPTIYSSWTHKKLIFRNTKISEIARIIEDTYGLEVVVPDDKLRNQKVSGTIINESLDGLLYAISETVEMKVTKNNDRIILKTSN